MNKIDYKEVIKSNYHGNANTFVGELHESEMFSEHLYNELCEAIKGYTEETRNNINTIDREYSWYIASLYSWFLIEMGCHFDPIDGHRIKNVTDKYLRDTLELNELRIVVEQYFMGDANIPNP